MTKDMFWEIYIDQQKHSKGEPDLATIRNSMRMACIMAEWEGILKQALLKGDNEAYRLHQAKIRNIFLKQFPGKPLPPELLEGRFPDTIVWHNG